MSQHYADTLKKHGKYVTFTMAPSLGHEILLNAVTYDALTSLVESLRQTGQR
jgi:hypothetical protein